MLDPSRLDEALRLLGDLLAERGESFVVAAIGGGALLLSGLSSRVTVDLDLVARRDGARWRGSHPMPPALLRAADDVARVLGLPGSGGEAGTPWMNAAPAVLFELGLMPPGWAERTSSRRFGALEVVLPHRSDLVALKLWACVDPQRGPAAQRDRADLHLLAPPPHELREAALWCARRDGTPGFLEHPMLRALVRGLGADPSEVLR